MSGDYSSTQNHVHGATGAEGQAGVKEVTPPVPVAEEPLEDVAANELLASNPETKSDSLTLTPDPSNFSMKHPLQARWTLWYDNPGKRVSSDHWEENVQKIMTFDTVEDFWCLFNNIQPPSLLAAGSNYHLFKEGVKPMWEDEFNRNGGKWVCQLPKQMEKAQMDDLWLSTMLSLVGEGFEECEEVCGAVVSIRNKADKISLWTRNWNNQFAVEHIGMTLRRQLNLPHEWGIGYQSHSDSMKRGSYNGNRSRYEA